jgi:alkylated DNA repair dioxygenase AlkB
VTALDLRYLADAVPDADGLLAYLRDHVAWLDRMRARRTASFGMPYDYSGQRYPAAEMPPPIAALAADVAGVAGHPFNNCLCNRYDTGEHTMGFHRDAYDGLVPTSTIAIASFGASRDLIFRSADRRERITMTLGHGSLLLMTRATQDHWQHALPRAPSAGLRISATLRWFAT